MQNKFRPMIRILLVAVVIVIGAGGLFYFQQKQEKSTAAFALLQVEKALDQNDLATLERHVNIPKFAESLVDHVFSVNRDEPESVAGKLEGWASRKFKSFVQPELKKTLEKQLRDYVATGIVRAEGVERLLDQPLLYRLWHEFSGGNIVYKGVGVVREKGKMASASLKFYRADIEKTLEVQLRMLRQGDLWVVVAVENLDEVLRRIEGHKVEVLSLKNEALRAQMKEHLRVVNVQKSEGVAEWDVGRGVMLQISFENIGGKPIDAFHATVYFMDAEKTVLKEVTLSDTDDIDDGEVSEKSWPMALNPLSKKENKIYELGPGDMIIDILLDEIKFTDGTILQTVDAL